MRELGAKELGKAYNQPEQVMAIMDNYSTRPNAITFLTYIPAKTTWAVFWTSGLINGVHLSAKGVPEDQRIRLLGTYIETFKGEALIIKEVGNNKDNDAGIHSYLWDRWVMDVGPTVLPHKAKRSLEGLGMLYLRLWKRKVIHGMFKVRGEKYGVFDRTQEGLYIGGGWTTGRRRKPWRGGKVKSTEL